MARKYDTYTEYLYDWAMTLWCAGTTFYPNDKSLVDISVLVHQRSVRAARAEGVTHPDDEPDDYIEEAEAHLDWREREYYGGEIPF